MFQSIFFLAMVLPMLSFGASYPEEYLFDMGKSDSPVASGWTPVYRDTVYTPKHGYGWDHPADESVDVPVEVPARSQKWHPLTMTRPGAPMLRDAIEDDDPIAFRVDVSRGRYSVVVTVGRCDKPRHDMAVRVNGRLVNDVIDAYGKIWGSQGGTPTRTVKAVVTATKTIRIDFTYKPSRPDDWKKYTTEKPEGGRLWFLDTNKNCIAGIRIRRLERPPVRVEHGTFICAVKNLRLSAAIKALSKGDLDRAEKEMDACEAAPFARACLYEWIAGNMSLDDRAREDEILSKAIALLKKIPQTATVKEHMDMDQRYVAAMHSVGMYNYESAKKATGLNCYERYWTAYDLCSPFAPGDPLYWKSLLMRGRVAYWNGREGGWKHCYDMAARHFAELKKQFPRNRLVRIYTGDKTSSAKDYSIDENVAPRWAVLEREALDRIHDVIRYWVERRQRENGELGGGWGDDVEILRTWAPAVLASDDKVARAGAMRLGNGVWNSDEVERGYSRNIGDVEHAAEPVSDTQPLLMAINYGNPIYFERCLETARDMATVWTGMNAFGHRHFRACYFSATQVSAKAPQTVDVALNGRAAKPVIWVAWYSGLPTARRLLEEWCTAWVEDARRTDRNKPKWIVPGSIRFEDDRIGGFSDHWWDTKGYFSKLPAMGYTSLLYHNLLAACALSGKPTYIDPLLAALELASQDAQHPNRPAAIGSREWVGRLHNCRAFIDVAEKWRLLSGDRRFDPYLISHGSGYLRYRLTGDLSRLEQEFQESIDSVQYNTEMVTSEVLFTDRVSIGGTTALFSAMTGGVGNPTYYPLHAVTWENLGDRVAVLVGDNGGDHLNLQAFNFSDIPRSVGMRVWSLIPGTYKMIKRSSERVGDEITLKTTIRQVKVKEPGSSLELNLPSHCLTGVQISIKKRGKNQRTLLPDLAISKSDVVIRPEKKEIRVTIHNIGAAPAEKINVRVRAHEKIIGRGKVARLDAPMDFIPKTATLVFQFKEPLPKEPITVEIDPSRSIQEHVKSNNAVVIGPAAGQ